MTDDSRQPADRAFAIKDLLSRRKASGRPYLEFLREPTMSMGIYHLPAGGVDGQSPHATDEVYYVLSGKSTFTVEGTVRSVKPGDVLFVRAGAEHRFSDITEDLTLLVYFEERGRAVEAGGSS